MCRDKACCWSRKNLCRDLFVNLRKLRFCRLWNFLGNPSQGSEVEWARNGVCWPLNLIFFKCGTQAVVGCSLVVLQALRNYFLYYLSSIILMFLYSILKWFSGLVFLRYLGIWWASLWCNLFSQCIITLILGAVACLSIRLIQAANHRNCSTCAVPYLFLLGESLQAVEMLNFESQVSPFVQEGRKAVWSMLNNWHVKEAVSLLSCYSCALNWRALWVCSCQAELRPWCRSVSIKNGCWK